MRGVALVPAVLRSAWRGRPIPSRLAEALGIDRCHWDALDARVWGALDAGGAPRAAERAVVQAATTLLTPRERERLASLRVLGGSWPCDLDPRRVPFRRRTFTVLHRLGALSPRSRLSQLTVGELLGAPGAGVVTLLEFACTAEEALTASDSYASHVETVVGAASPELAALAEEPWAASVAGDDGRFSDLLGAVWRGTVAELVTSGPPHAQRQLLHLLPDLRARMADLAAAPLEDALAAYVRGLLPDAADDRIAAVLDRLGLRGHPPLRLVEAAALVGLTRERIRQLEAKVRERRSGSAPTPFLPQLDCALAHVADAVPVLGSDVARLVVSSGVSARPFSVTSLVAASQLLGRDVPFVVSELGGDAVVLSRRSAGMVDFGRMEAAARRQARRYGASTVRELAAELAAHSAGAPDVVLTLALKGFAGGVVTDDGWFWFTDDRSARGTFVGTTLKMLCVTTPLSAESIADGFRRQRDFRGLAVLPPTRVLEQVYASHPCFRADADGLVWPAEAIAPEHEPGPLDKRMVEILRGAPGGVLPRAALIRACRRAGLNRSSANLYASYSPCIEEVEPGVFAARGTAAIPKAAAAVEGQGGTPATRQGRLPGGAADGQTPSAA